MAPDGRVVHQQVEPSEAIDQLADAALDLGPRAHVPDQRERPSTGPFDLPRRGLEAVAAARHQPDRYALAGQRPCDRQARAPAPAGHEPDLAGQPSPRVHRAPMLPRSGGE